MPVGASSTLPTKCACTASEARTSKSTCGASPSGARRTASRNRPRGPSRSPRGSGTIVRRLRASRKRLDPRNVWQRIGGFGGGSHSASGFGGARRDRRRHRQRHPAGIDGQVVCNSPGRAPPPRSGSMPMAPSPGRLPAPGAAASAVLDAQTRVVRLHPAHVCTRRREAVFRLAQPSSAGCDQPSDHRKRARGRPPVDGASSLCHSLRVCGPARGCDARRRTRPAERYAASSKTSGVETRQPSAARRAGTRGGCAHGGSKPNPISRHLRAFPASIACGPGDRKTAGLTDPISRFARARCHSGCSVGRKPRTSKMV